MDPLLRNYRQIDDTKCTLWNSKLFIDVTSDIFLCIAEREANKIVTKLGLSLAQLSPNYF